MGAVEDGRCFFGPPGGSGGAAFPAGRPRSVSLRMYSATLCTVSSAAFGGGGLRGEDIAASASLPALRLPFAC